VAALSRWRPQAPALAAGLLLAAVYLITRVRMQSGLPYFLDEGIYANFSYEGAQSASQLMATLTIGKPPLQAWFGIPWQWLGVNPLDSMRLVSITAGALTLPVVYALGARVAGRRTGLLAALLALLIPFGVVNDAVGIEEPLVTLVMASALLLQLRLAAAPSLRVGALLAVVLAAGVLTKQSCEAAVFLLPVSLLGFDFSPAGRRRRVMAWLGAVALALVAVAGAELTMRSSRHWAEGQAFDRTAPLVRSLGAVLHHPFATTGHALRVFAPAITGYITLPLIALAVVGAVLLARERLRLTAALVAWVLAPALAALTFTLVPYPRHLMYVLPPALVLMGVTLARLAEQLEVRLAQPHAVAAAGALTGLLLLPGLVLDARALAHPATARYPGLDDLQYVTGVPAGGAWPPLVRAIRHRARGERVVVLVAQADPNIVRFLLSADPAAPAGRFRVVLPDQPGALRAQFAIVDQLPFGNPRALALIAREHMVVAGRFARPRRGPVTTLYQRRA
jgi:4-amino-4-deoxy-L-arabinose transferase-like glycosyltransferase